MTSKVPSETTRDTDSPAAEDARPGPMTWRGAVTDVWRSVRRHKVISAVIAVCVVGSLVAIGVAGTASSRSGSASSAPSSSAPASSAQKVAAAFTLPALGGSGQQVTLSAYAGKPLVVNFFASWCGPCKTETPRLAAFYRAEHGKVAIVGLDENDTQANALSFTHADKVTYPVGFDPQMTAASAYEVSALPQTFFLDARHRVVDRVFGAVTQAELDKGIALATKG
jgi:cytochrome c biogenesis protein CcmG/thiol:disulfide interchange protein DsbE